MTGLPFPDIDPIAFYVMGFGVRWYSLAYLAGFLLGWFYILKLVKNNNERPNKVDIDDFIAPAVLGVILGGRIGYALFYQPEFYLSNPSQILKIWQGGMSFHGGALGVLIALCLYCFFRKISILRMGDVITAAAPIGLFFGRLANFANSELYGRVTDVAWGVRFPTGGGIPRHPSQIYESLLEGFVLFFILMVAYKKFKDKPGVTASLFLIGYGAFRFIVEYFREPDPQYGLFLDMISMGQILSLPMVVLGLLLMIFSLKRVK